MSVRQNALNSLKEKCAFSMKIALSAALVCMLAIRVPYRGTSLIPATVSAFAWGKNNALFPFR